MKTGGGQAGTSTPANDRQNPQLSSSTAGPVEDPEQNTLRAQIPAQVRPQNRLVYLCGAGQVGGVRTGRPSFTPENEVGLGWFRLVLASWRRR